MKTLDDVWRAHSSAVRARGRAYVAEGRVQHLEESETGVRATVRGTERYTVVLTRGVRGWTHACSCVAHAEHGGCKHVCAVLLQLKASREGAPAADEVGNEDLDALADRTWRPDEGALDSEDDDEEEDEEEEDDAAFSDQRDAVSELLADPAVPEAVKRQLRASLASGLLRTGRAAPGAAERSRAERLFAALELHPPSTTVPQRTTELR